MRREVLSGKGVMTRARRKREHPRRPARRAPETSGPSGRPAAWTRSRGWNGPTR